MSVGDIVLVNTIPPHLASVTSGSMVICEDGTVLPLDASIMTVLYSAMDVIKELEKGVLNHNETW